MHGNQKKQHVTLKKVSRTNRAYELYARKPEETTRDLAIKMYGEKAREFL